MKNKSSNFIAFDIGSNKIAAMAANIGKNTQPRIIAQVIRSSWGVKSGVITDLAAAEESFVSVIYSLENEIDKSVREVALTVSGSGTKSYYVSQRMKLGDAPISKSDVKKLIQKAVNEFSVIQMEMIHYFPIEFLLDDENIVDNPIGMYGSVLSVQVHIIAASSARLLNITKCLARCQVEVCHIMASVYASGLATLTEDEMKLGSLIIDFGSHSTSFAVFLEGKCIFVGGTACGSHNITTEIARSFSVNINTAEKLKILHGSSDHTLLLRDETIRLDNFEEARNYSGDLSISSAELAKVIHGKLNEIFEDIFEQYKKSNLDNIISRRLVITGGGANLHGLKPYLSKKFNKQTRIGIPTHIDGFTENYNTTIFSSVMGIIFNEVRKLRKDNPDSMLTEDRGWFRKTFNWFRENI